MIKDGIATPCLDPHANLSTAVKAAAANAGYGIPFITDEAKFAESERQRLASLATGIPPALK